MTSREFLATFPVFTSDEFAAQVETGRVRGTRAVESLLAYYTRAGRVLRVRRGLYATVPPGASPRTTPVDPYLLAGKMADDAVLAYHTALEFHGKAYSVHERFTYLTGHASRPVVFRSYRFRGVAFPKALRDNGQEGVGVQDAERLGVGLRVTGLERVLVDVLDRPDLSGAWEEIWRSLEQVEFFDLEEVVRYAGLLGNSTTAAKVGFFLEQHRESLRVTDRHLQELLTHRPQKPHYLARGRRVGGRFIAQWNLVVPDQVLERSWGDVT